MQLQPLTESDLTLISELQPADWPDILPTHRYYINTPFCFPVKVTIDKKTVGLGTLIVHNETAWLAHIIVHPENRNKGIGRFITRNLMDSAKDKHCDTIYLIATDLGEPVYKKAGFETETEYLFFKDIPVNNNRANSDFIVTYKDDFRIQISNLDLGISGEDRMLHLEEHLSEGFVFLQDEQVSGFYLPTFGEGFISAKTEIAGLELMKFRLASKKNASFPIDNVKATEYMQQLNLKSFKTAKRMRHGVKRPWRPECIYNRTAGNLG